MAVMNVEDQDDRSTSPNHRSRSPLKETRARSPQKEIVPSSNARSPTKEIARSPPKEIVPSSRARSPQKEIIPSSGMSNSKSDSSIVSYFRYLKLNYLVYVHI